MPYKDPQKSRECRKRWADKHPDYQQQYYKQKRDKKIAYAHQYSSTHREEVRERKKMYREEHKEEIKEKKRVYREQNKEKIARHSKQYRSTRLDIKRRSDRKKKYNMTDGDFNSLFQKQNGLCALCHKPIDKEAKRAIAIDHDHTTDQVRGILHPKCNLLIGHADDDVEVLQNAIDYLNKNKQNTEDETIKDEDTYAPSTKAIL